MEFKKFAQKIKARFDEMAKGDLFVVGTTHEELLAAWKQELYDTYLNSFPEGTNPIYKERTTHDCNCCKNFIRQMGNVVSIKNGKLQTIWDITIDDGYQVVADAMAAFVRKQNITGVYRRSHKFGNTAGAEVTKHMDEDTGAVINFNHFYAKVPAKYMSHNPEADAGVYRNAYETYKRSMKDLTISSAEVVLELIDANSIYRGTEHRATVQNFIKHKKAYDKSRSKGLHLWTNAAKHGNNLRFRNTVIGTLLVDISEGRDLTEAVKSFEAKVAPQNYKRTSAIVTPRMAEEARKTITELGYMESLERRHATIDDITINNILFADRSSKKALDVFDEIASNKVDSKKFDKATEISYDEFVEKILPTSESIELLLEGRHSNNFCSLIAPSNPDSKNILKWGNNFSWAYRGGYTDSVVKEEVAKKGGNVNGFMRFSIMWNTDDRKNGSDLDAHCHIRRDKGSANHIYYGAKKASCGGMLDVDITSPRGIAVENIYWSKKSQIADGVYVFSVNNYSSRNNGTGFSGELAIGDDVIQFDHPSVLPSGGTHKIFRVTKKGDSITVHKYESHCTFEGKQFSTWGVESGEFHPVRVVMNSPNHWDGQEIGNKHAFFILDGCMNDEPVNGLYNEYLDSDLNKHRKALEIISEKLKVAVDKRQLSGVGFSSTKKDSVTLRVKGKTQRVLKVKF